MSRSAPRVPPTFSDRLERLVAVATEHSAGPGIYRLNVSHDDGCPALETQSLSDCTCEPKFDPPERLE